MRIPIYHTGHLPNPSAANKGEILFEEIDALNGVFRVNTGSQWSSPVSSVTSVGLSMPSIFSVAGSPVTTSGTLTVTQNVQTANTVYAGPTAGAAATPTFRTLVSSDLPLVNLSSGVTGILPITNGGTQLSSTPTNGQVLIGNGVGYTLSTLTAGSNISITNGAGSITIAATGTGSVTSVGLTVPSIFSVSGSPITTSGVLAVTANTQAANTFYSGPSAGAAAIPTFRSIVAADIPAISLTSGITGVLPIANGGTNTSTTPLNGELLIGNGTGFALTTLTQGSNVTITNGAGSITISATSGVTTVGAINGTSTANGASISGSTLTLHAADATNGGVLVVGSPQVLAGQKTFTSAISVTPTTNQLILGTTNTTTINASAPSASRVYTLSDAGANATFVMSEGTETINGDKTFTSLFTNSISESTTNAGVTVDEIRLRSDTLVTPAITLASVTAMGSATNIYLGLIPKGTGAIVAQVPDNTSTGGNARGTNAIDLQLLRGAATQVASGDRSAILGGISNTASGINSVAAGNTNIVSGQTSFAFAQGATVNGNTSAVIAGTSGVASSSSGGVFAGANNTVASSGTNSVILGGQQNVSNGVNGGILAGLNNVIQFSTTSVICGGSNNVINPSSLNCFIAGGSGNETSDEYCYALGRRSKALSIGCYVVSDSTDADFNSTGVNQYSARFAGGYRLTGGSLSMNDREYVHTSSDATTIGAVTADLNTFSTSNNTLYLYTADVTAATNAGDTASFKLSIKVKNVSNTLTVGTPFLTGSDIDGALAGASVAFVDSGTDAILRVTGVGGETINWKSVVSEVVAAFP